MIPLKALAYRRRTPWMTLALILANVFVFLYELSLGPVGIQQLFFQYGMVPARLQFALTAGRGPLTAAVLTMFTSMFLHGGWLHIIGNMWFLWVFGSVVEDRLGRTRYLVFYLICGLGAALTQTFVSWGSHVPTIGASGAISGVMGAYLLLFPGSQVLTLVPLLIIWFTVRLPAILMIGYWFLIQFVSGLASLHVRNSGGVAFWAHVGGFLLGAALALRIRREGRAVWYSP
jgi:rhomboid family protein